MTRKIKTIKYQGRVYAQVSERVKAIHEATEGKVTITTTYDVTPSGNIVFTATVEVEGKGKYTGHSFGKVAQSKSFEKQETIAVGRALAFAGYLADGGIASAEELQEHAEEIDAEALSDAVAKIQESKDVEELNRTYKDLPLAIKQSKQVIDVCKEHKKKLTTPIQA
jgi:tetrahydromethanopterin S-methyltransferase subunit A